MKAPVPVTRPAAPTVPVADSSTGNLSVVVPVTPPFSQMVDICETSARGGDAQKNPWFADLEHETGGSLPATRSWCTTFLRLGHLRP